MRSSGTSALARSTVSTMSGRSLARGRSCLGRCGVLAGQKRDPIPPARMVTHTRGLIAAEDLFDSGNEPLRAERLGKKVVGATGQRRFPVPILSLRSQEDDPSISRPWVRRDCGENLEFVGVSHHGAENNQIDVCSSHLVQALIPAGSHCDLVPAATDNRAEHASNVGLFVNH
jgi:hypothetical protein